MKAFNSVKAYEIVNPECPCTQGKALHETYATAGCVTATQAAYEAAGHMARVIAEATVRAHEQGAEVLFFNRSGPSVTKNEDGLYIGRWRGSVVVTRYPFAPKLNELGILTADDDKSEVANA